MVGAGGELMTKSALKHFSAISMSVGVLDGSEMRCEHDTHDLYHWYNQFKKQGLSFRIFPSHLRGLQLIL
jgi:hypothetical protein